MYIEYPKWLYHATHEPVIVQDPDEETALGAGWAGSPAAFAAAAAPAHPKHATTSKTRK